MRALLLQAFYAIRSERQLMEQLNYNLPFGWFVGFSADAPAWNPTIFPKNRDRLIEGKIAGSSWLSCSVSPESKRGSPTSTSRSTVR